MGNTNSGAGGDSSLNLTLGSNGTTPSVKVIREDSKDGKDVLSLRIKKSHERFLPRFIDKGNASIRTSDFEAITDSWKQVKEGTQAFVLYKEDQGAESMATPLTLMYDVFYAGLHAIEPSIQQVLEGNMVRQSRFLIGMIRELAGLEAAVVSGKGLAGMENVIESNVSLGIRAQHYEPIGIALKYTLAYCIGGNDWMLVQDSWNRLINLHLTLATSRTVTLLEERQNLSESEQYDAVKHWRTSSDSIGKVIPPFTSANTAQSPRGDLSSPRGELDPTDGSFTGSDVDNVNLMEKPYIASTPMGSPGGFDSEARISRSGRRSWFSGSGERRKLDAEEDDELASPPLDKTPTLTSTQSATDVTAPPSAAQTPSSNRMSMRRISAPEGAASATPAPRRRGSLMKAFISGVRNKEIVSTAASTSASPEKPVVLSNSKSPPKPPETSPSSATPGAPSRRHSSPQSNEKLQPGGKGVATSATATAAEVLAFIDRSEPIEVCRCAESLAGALARCLSPPTRPADRSDALRAVVGWTCKLLLIDREDERALKARRQALAAQLPVLVPLIVGCLEVSAAEVPSLQARRKLQFDAMEALSQMARFLQVRFLDYIDIVQKSVSPLLAASGVGLRTMAATTISFLPLCSKDGDSWAHAAARVAVEAHSLLHQAWPVEGVNMGGIKLNAEKIQELLKGHALLPVLTESELGSMGAYMRAVSRRVPALLCTVCKLLAIGARAGAARANAEAKAAAMLAELGEQPATNSAGNGAPGGRPSITSSNGNNGDGGDKQLEGESNSKMATRIQCLLNLALVGRIHRMAISLEELGPLSAREAGLPVADGALSAAAMQSVVGCLQSAGLSLLEALLGSTGVIPANVLRERAIGYLLQYLGTVPVEEGLRGSVYRTLGVGIRTARRFPGNSGAGALLQAVPFLIRELQMSVQHADEVPPPPPTGKTQVPGPGYRQPRAQSQGGPIRLSASALRRADVTTMANGLVTLGYLFREFGELVSPNECIVVEAGLMRGMNLLLQHKDVVAAQALASQQDPLTVSEENESLPSVVLHAATQDAFMRLAFMYIAAKRLPTDNPLLVLSVQVSGICFRVSMPASGPRAAAASTNLPVRKENSKRGGRSPLTSPGGGG